MNLIEQVLRLDKEATKGPWEIPPEDLNGRIWAIGPVAGYDYGPLEMRHDSSDASLIALYRTAAPKLARANQKLMEFVQWADDPCAQNWPTWAPLRLDKGDICHATALAGAVLAEIEKELST